MTSQSAGQTKMKSVLVDFLVSAGIKPVAIVSYNHLGNNDGKNLSEPEQFRSKEISKSNVVDDMVGSNRYALAPFELGITVCVCVCLSVSVCASVCAYAWISLFTCSSMYICVCKSACMCMLEL